MFPRRMGVRNRRLTTIGGPVCTTWMQKVGSASSAVAVVEGAGAAPMRPESARRTETQDKEAFMFSERYGGGGRT